MSGHPPSRDEEAELIAKAAGGDEEAFTRLYDLHHDRIYRYVYYRVRQAEDAEDLVQKVFLQAWRGLGRYRRTATPFLGWLYTIAHNVTVSFYRAQKPVGDLQHDVPDLAGEADLDRAVDDRFEQGQLLRAIMRLRPDQQQVINMRFLGDLDYREIAATLGKSEGNVRVIQHRALQELRRLLGTKEAGYEPG